MVRPVRLLYLNPSLTQGGAERHVVDIVSNLDRSRFDVAMCVVRPGIHYTAELPAGEPRFHLQRALFSPGTLRAVVETIRRFQPDVLHSHLNDGNLLARLATRFAPVPAVVTSVHLDDMSWLYRRVERMLWRYSTRVVAVSRGVRDFLIGKVGVPADRIEVVVNGTDPKRFVPAERNQRLDARQRFRIDESALVALMPARIARQKNQDLVIEALGRLKKTGRLPAEFQLLLAGRTSSNQLLKRLRGMVAIHGLDNQVRFLGTVVEMQMLYWASDVILMPSRSEGSSIAALESMSAGLPILISDGGNTDGVIVDGQTGWQVPANDTVALESALDVIMKTSPADRHRLGVAGRRRIEGGYTLTRVARDLEALYMSLLENAGQKTDKNGPRGHATLAGVSELEK